MLKLHDTLLHNTNFMINANGCRLKCPNLHNF